MIVLRPVVQSWISEEVELDYSELEKPIKLQEKRYSATARVYVNYRRSPLIY